MATTLLCILSLTFNLNAQETTIVETFNKTDEDKEDEKSGIFLSCSVRTFPTFTIVVLALMFGSFGVYILVIYVVSWSIFYLSVENHSCLFQFRFTSLCGIPAKLAPLSQLMRGKSKTNRHPLAHFFPRLAPASHDCFGF